MSKAWKHVGGFNALIYQKSMGKNLTNSQGLTMKEEAESFTGEQLGATFFQGTKPIDGVWATANIVVTGAYVMPTGYSICNHQLFVINFLTSSMIGNTPRQIARSGA